MEENCELLKICKTYDLKKIKDFLENYNGEKIDHIISNICIHDSFNKSTFYNKIKVIDLLIDYSTINKIKMFDEKEYEYLLNKGIHNDVFLDYYKLRHYILTSHSL